MTELLVRVVGETNSEDAYRLRDFLQRSSCAFEWLDASSIRSSSTIPGLQFDSDHLPLCILPPFFTGLPSRS